LPVPDLCPETGRPPGPPPELPRLRYAWLKTVAQTARSFIPWSGPACPSLAAWSGASCGARVTHNWLGLSIASSVRGGSADLEIRTDRLRWETCRSVGKSERSSQRLGSARTVMLMPGHTTHVCVWIGVGQGS